MDEDPEREARITRLILLGHLMCPSCANAVPGRCCICGKDIDMYDQHIDADPYCSSVKDDEREHLLCRECDNQSILETVEALEGVDVTK